jgi:hypothetical protein
LIAEAFDKASRDHQLLRLASSLVACHFQDRVHRFLLRAIYERAGVDHDDVGVFGAAGQFGSGARKHAHHDFAVDQVLGASETNESHLLRTRVRAGWRILRRFLAAQLRGTANSEVLYWHAIFEFYHLRGAPSPRVY